MIAPPPPRLDDYRAGHALVAGLGRSVVLPDLDFETYSEAGYVWDNDTQRWAGPPGAPGATKGLGVVGTEPYVRHPSFNIIWMAYDLKDGQGRRRWHPGLPPPADLLGYLATGGPIEAWNVAFERWVWELHCVPRLGWPAVLHPDQWYCAMAKARAHSLPGALGNAGKVLNLETQKDPEGAALMKRLSMPRQPTKTDPRPRMLPVYTAAHSAAREAEILATDPDATPARRLKAAALSAEEHLATLKYGDYCETDIAAEAEASSRVPDMPPSELAWWREHERINRRGVHIDRGGVENCIAVVEQVFRKYNGELLAITGIDSASKVAQLLGWLHGRGTHLDSLDEEAVQDALAHPLNPPDVRRVLLIRAAAGSASIKKLFSIRNRLSHDDRLRDLYVYYGARTGRSTGEGPQPTNLKAAGPDMVLCGTWLKDPAGDSVFIAGSGCQQYHGQHAAGCPFCGRPKLAKPRVDEWNPTVAEQALAVIATRSLEWVEMVYGDALATIAGCLRALFNAAPGHDLISTDYNSIEAVGLAMISGERWRTVVFCTHGKIYEASASAMFGVPLDEILGAKKATGQHHPLRKKGKIGELAFGYQGWVGSALAFDMPGTEDEIKADILRWRAASPAVVWMWGGQEMRKARSVVQDALVPGYEGSVAEWLAPVAAANKWDRSTYYFGVEGMAVLAVLEPDTDHPVMRLDGTPSGISFRCKGKTLYCSIPSGRDLTYHNVVLAPSDRGGWSLSYEGWNTNPKNGPKGWVRMNTWGGRLVENINQATCRDILAPACIALGEAGYPVVLHTYDEPVSEVPEGFGSVEEYERICEVRPAWAHDWPIRAPSGYRAKRYRKG